MILRLLKHPLLWVAVVAVGCYFTSDLLDAGNTLNTSFPGLYMGWVFWGSLTFLLWMIVIAPLVGFLGLPQWKDISSATESEQLKYLSRYARTMVKCGDRMIKKSKPGDARLELERRTKQLLDAYTANLPLDQKVRKLHTAVGDFREYVMNSALKTVIRKYVLCAGGAVVLSRKSFVDALLIFGLQIKLMIELSRSLGHKPSWAFILCCLVWVVVNSLFISILEENDMIGFVGSSLAEITGVKSVDMLQDIPFLKSLGKQMMESMYAGASLYVTGVLVLRRLMGETRRLTPRELLKLRWEGLTQARAFLKN